VRHRRRALLAGVVAAAVALLLAELGFRVFGFPYAMAGTPSENALAQFDPDLGWAYRPGLATTVDFGGGSPVPVAFDEHGVRVPRPGWRHDPGAPSVLFVGCSFTFGHGLRWEDTFPARVGDLARGALQPVNLGVQAYGTDQALLALERHLDRFNVKAVVYTFLEFPYDGHAMRNANYDRRQLYPGGRFLGTKPLYELGADGRPRLARRPVPFAAKPGPGAGIGARLSWLVRADYPHSWVADALALSWRRVTGAAPPQDFALTGALILEMQRQSRERGASFVVVRWRYGQDPAADALFARLGVPVIDTLGLAPLEWGTMVDPATGHPDKRAAELVAGAILRHL
jgi:hypothetical protein